MPIVVLPNEMLWAVNFSAEGVIERGPQRVDRCACFVGEKYEIGNKLYSESTRLSHVEFVTLSGLRALVAEYISSEDGFELLFLVMAWSGILTLIDGFGRSDPCCGRAGIGARARRRLTRCVRVQPRYWVRYCPSHPAT